MIAHLRGTLLEKHPNEVIVEAQGVGYLLTIPVSTYTSLAEVGAEVKLRVHTHVREDAISLFGFLTAEEKGLFEKLITVNGIGPKLAVTVLSGIPTADLITAIRDGSVAQLTRVPGIGKKIAERLVVELRDKIGLPDKGAPAKLPIAPPLSAVEDDVLSALGNLGCPKPAAEAAIQKARAEGVPLEFEPLFRRALALVR